MLTWQLNILHRAEHEWSQLAYIPGRTQQSNYVQGANDWLNFCCTATRRLVYQNSADNVPGLTCCKDVHKIGC